MLSASENELATRIGPGTPMGEVIRRYWLPAVLTRDLPNPDSDPLRVRLMGEDLVAYRDTSGNVGLLGNHCPHRGASLFFGRNEESGLRCVYHGWKFDTSGACVDMPNEPPESNFKDKIRHTAYPCVEKAGVVWTYMGPPDKQPPDPDMEWMRMPEGYGWVSRTIEHCNYLQAMEGGLDTSHSSFAHRNLDPEGLKNPRARSTNPRLEVLDTDYGYMYASIRSLPKEGLNYVRVYQYVMPFYQLRAGGSYESVGNIDGHIWVPIDDENTMVWNIHGEREHPLTQEQWERYEHRMGRGPEDFFPGTYELKASVANDWNISRERQKTVNFTGIEGTNTQDFALQETMGPIYDRTQEHLGSADTAIIRMRRMLIDSAKDIEKGIGPRGTHNEARNARAAQMHLPIDAYWYETQLKEELVAQY